MIAKHKFWRVLTRVHKWTGLVIGIQLVLWFSSGFFMSFFDINDVRGDHIAEKAQFPLTDVSGAVRPPPAQYTDGDLYGQTLRSVIGKPVWQMTGSGDPQYIDAQTGQVWPGVNEMQVRRAAGHYYKGTGVIMRAVKLETVPLEYRKDPPVWQISYDDKYKTRLYLNAQTADLESVRTRLWRAFDFMWMLHIMDYKERTNFNSWWLKIISFVALLFALSGVGLVIHRIFLRPRPKKKH